MELPSDIEYIKTKSIKKRNSKLEFPMLELQNWFFEKYGIKPINIIYEILEHNKKPRLNIIWELDSHKEKFILNSNEFSQKENLITNKFKEIVKLEKNIKTENLFVIFSNFSYVALVEANEKIKKREIKELENNLSEFGVWKIFKHFSSALCILNTNKQLEESKTGKVNEIITEKYKELISNYDEFGYSSIVKLNILFDSKERIDKEYNGNLSNYFRNW
jgi:hypothetical protein